MGQREDREGIEQGERGQNGGDEVGVVDQSQVVGFSSGAYQIHTPYLGLTWLHRSTWTCSSCIAGADPS